MRNNFAVMICGLIALSLAGGVQAQSGHAPHTHGEGELSIVLDGSLLTIDVSLPGADVVGFEHKAKHEEDINKVRNAMASLLAADKLFQFQNSAACEAIEAKAKSSLIEGDEDHDHGHGDFDAEYAFRCASPSEFGGRPVNTLSIGQQQRVAVARALIGNPGLVIADEPTSALDARNREMFLNLISKVCKENNTTLIVVSHDEALFKHFDHRIDMETLNSALPMKGMPA